MRERKERAQLYRTLVSTNFFCMKPTFEKELSKKKKK